jgi:hypothetical protein
MRNIVYIKVLFFIFYCGTKSYSQDTIYLMSGKQIEAKVIEIDFNSNGYISYEIKKKNKTKNKLIEKDDVYSISYYNNKKEIIYKSDVGKGFILDQNQMYNFIIGEQVAWNKYKTPKLIIAGGVLSGMTGGLFGLYGILLPSSYTTAISFVNPKIQIDNIKQPSSENIDYYKMGFNSIAKSKNIKSTIIASISGIFTTAILITALQINSIDFKK